MNDSSSNVSTRRDFIKTTGRIAAASALAGVAIPHVHAASSAVILTTPLAFRWVHFRYAIQKGLNVFMEKPLTSDGPTSRRMLKLGEEATSKNLKVGVGLMSRHARSLQELQKRIQGGEIGDVIL